MTDAFRGAADRSNPLWARALLAVGGVAALPLAGIESTLNFGYHVDVSTDRAAHRFATAAILTEDSLEKARLFSEGVGDIAFVTAEGLAIGLPGTNTAASPVAQGLGRATGAVNRVVNPSRWFDDIGEAAADGIRNGARGLLPETAPVSERFLYFHHGTSAANAGSIRQRGVDIHRSRVRVDFGRGFYTTLNKAQAEKWAAQKFGDSGKVLSFRVPASRLEVLKGLEFAQASPSWASFVRHHRLGGSQHNFDFVTGPALANPRQFALGWDPKAIGTQTVWSTEAAVELLMRGMM
ncbi:MAG: DUF3990 domain-containing protein [Thermoanaerobaculia bacterium]|nr:DUF3990 domain-containing protein [Thermoanaerobaculia bacterium]